MGPRDVRMRAVTARFGGALVPPRGRARAVAWNVAGLPVRYAERSIGASWWAGVTAHARAALPTAQIRATAGIPRGAAAILRGPRLRADLPDFDAGFECVVAPSPDPMPPLPATLWTAFLALASCTAPAAPLLDVGRGRAVALLPNVNAFAPEALLDAVAASCRLLQTLFAACGLPHPGTQESGPASDSGAGTCQICGGELAGERHRCPECRTPHHRECWEYLGGCSTYGCARAHLPR